MNRSQRIRLAEIVELLEGLQAELTQMSDDEHDKYEALPESLQNSERGSAFEEAGKKLSECADSIGDAIDGIGEMIDK